MSLHLSQYSADSDRAPIKLVFFDIDGTLLNTHGHYSQYLQQQIQRLHEGGVKTAIASGRPSYAARFLIEELGINDAGVFCTGAEIFDPSSKEHLALHPLPLELVRNICTRAEALGIYCELYTPEYHSVQQSCDISRVHAQHLRVEPRLINASDLLNTSPDVVKLLVGSRKAPNSLLQQLAAEFPQLHFAFAHFLARPEWEFASIISPKADKHQAFEQLLRYHELSADEVMAIGDSHSDRIFIERAGVGVAMGNASEDLKAAADFVTYNADDDGVAYALETLVI